jgi:peptidoglycan/xylan/chitin deacetylase (PgdA/CDA1 family)
MKMLLKLVIVLLFPIISTGDAHIFTLHRVGPADGTTTIIPPKKLIAILQYCRENNYTIATLSQLVEWIKEKRPIKKVVVFTFDDGYKSVYTSALPIFNYFNAKFDLLLYVEAIQYHFHPYLNWDEVRKLQEAGEEVGFHSYAHPSFLRLTPSEMVKDLNRSIQVMGKHLSHFFYFFAYPYDLSSWRSDRVVSRFFPVILNGGSVPVNRFTPLTSLSRYECFGDLKRFKWILKQKYLPVRIKVKREKGYWFVDGEVYGDFIPKWVRIKIVKGIREPVTIFRRIIPLVNGKFQLKFPFPPWGLLLDIRYKERFWRKRL